MTAALAGQTCVVLLVVAGLLRAAHTHGFLRGWRARDASGGAVRIDASHRVAGSYRAKKTPITCPIAPHDDHEDYPHAG